MIASGLTPSDRVVTTGFANLADGSKVIVGKDEQTPSADLAPRKRRSSRDAQGGARTANAGLRRARAGRAKAIKRVKPDRRRGATNQAAERRRSHDSHLGSLTP